MKNPWLDIPLSDLEGHMALPGVAQAELLAGIFEKALKAYEPPSVAVLACAGGCGFERISAEVTKRVVGLDLNPDYIAEARRRFTGRFGTLDLFTGDLQTEDFDFQPVDLIFASLLFEYVDPVRVLPKIAPMLKPDGCLVTVLQLPSVSIPDVTPSPFTSLGSLAEFMRLVPPRRLEKLAGSCGFIRCGKRIEKSSAGKRFQVLTFRPDIHRP